MENCIYSKLPSTSGTIRLLNLLPGSRVDDIKCIIYESELGSCQYQALSYAWHESAPVTLESSLAKKTLPHLPSASATTAHRELKEHEEQTEPRHTILCNGQEVDVSENLHSALQHLRRTDRVTTLWVDALCINQRSDSERTHQVNMMRDIYEKCSDVIIWLGKPSSSLGRLSRKWLEQQSFDFTYAINSRVEWHDDERDRPKADYYSNAYLNFERTLVTVESENIDVFGVFCLIYLLAQGTESYDIRFFSANYIENSAWSSKVIKALWTILDSSWWRRLWVVQESVVASKATIHYGTTSAPWTMFSKAAATHMLNRHWANLHRTNSGLTNDPLLQFSRTITEIESTRREWKTAKVIAPLQLLRKFRSREATDARDKVFALVGLMGYQKPIRPDYDLSLAKVYTASTVALIKSTNSLCALTGTIKGTTKLSAPSWVTDWSATPPPNEYDRLSRLQLYQASDGLTAHVTLHSSSILEVRGYLLGVVEACGPELPYGQVERLRATVTQWQSNIALDRNRGHAYTAGGTLEEAFWRTLCADTLPTDTLQEDNINRMHCEYQRADSYGLNCYSVWQARPQNNNRMTSMYGRITMRPANEAPKNNETRNRFHHAIESANGHRKFFVTRGGYIGTGPPSLQIGDRIFVVAGSRVPFILRRSRLNDARPPCLPGETTVLIPGPTLDIQDVTCGRPYAPAYELVGDAYVHGIMDGEVVEQARALHRAPLRLFLV